MSEHKIIGFAANCGKNRFFSHGRALLVTGDVDTLKACIISRFRSNRATERYDFRKIRYRDIKKALDSGTSFSLDEIAYNRFAATALEDGRKVTYPFPERLKKNVAGLPVITMHPKPQPAPKVL
ncbi:MAG: hypothetical protein PHQ27_06555 [Victivallales bacterium]|nr:hypothetical protein [Victivallales bacterium]